MRFVAINKPRRPLRAKPDVEYATYHRVADRHSPAIERQFITAIRDLRSKVGVHDVMNLLLMGRSGAVDELAIPWDELAAQLAPVKAQLEAALVASGKATARTWKGAVVQKADKKPPLGPDEAEVNLVFRERNARVEDWAATRSSTLIREITEESRAAVRGIVTETIVSGDDYGKRAQRIKDAVGLTTNQAAAVSRYRDALVDQGMGAERTDELVDQYAERTLKRRAETIARTETMRATNQGQLEYWNQLADDGIVNRERIVKMWVVTPDDRLCPLCEPMAEAKVGVDENFATPIGEVDGPPLHPNCRCTISMVPAEKEDDGNGTSIWR